ncbi:MAG: VirB4 family type IV secretion system protein [Candidatus Dormibacteria bacterium]
MKVERVPLAVDAQVRYQLGPLQLPLRAVVLLACAFPVALAAMGLPFLSGSSKLVAPVLVIAVAVAIAAPTVEGIWVLTYALFRVVEGILPAAVVDGVGVLAEVRAIGTEGLEVRPRETPSWPAILRRRMPALPHADRVEDGLFRITPGGWRAIVRLDAPATAVSTDEYGSWTDAVVAWLNAVGVPAQVLAISEHHDRVAAQRAFDGSYRGRDIPLRDLERDLVSEVADRTLSLRNYVVLCPNLADGSGIPFACRPWRFQNAVDGSREEALRVLESALRLVGNHGLRVQAADHEEVAWLILQTPLGARQAAHCGPQVLLGDEYQAYITVRALPPVVQAGAVIGTFLRTHLRGVASLYIAPVDPQVARKKVKAMRQAYQAVAASSGDVDARVMLGDIETLGAELAARQKTAHVVALTLGVRAGTQVACEELVEKVIGSLEGDGLRPVRCSLPGFAPALAVAPGMAPLGRSLILTTNGVVACLLPTLGTPFGRSDEPFVGINVQTGTPAYLSVFRGRKNMNLLCVGTSGAGKSVTMKTLLYRHAAQGARVVVIDPDSEYGPLMEAVGGTYVELGRHSINALAVDPAFSPDDAAGCVVPALSVMAGNEVGMSPDGHPIRRLPEEDKGWLHGEVAGFFAAWRRAGASSEPVLSDLLEYLDRVSVGHACTDQERERCRVIMFRLRTFTQGARGRIFNAPTSVKLDGGSFAIGLRELALQYRADLTPALAIILGFVLGDLMRRRGQMVVLVDEAHHVTTDPDAGQVLARMVRQARKYGAGVWMASQQVEDFLAADGLGRTLAATAATKVILGLEASMADDAAAAFKLTANEVRWLVDDCPAGRAVLISGDERGVVDVRPGSHLAPMVSTTAEPVEVVAESLTSAAVAGAE